MKSPSDTYFYCIVHTYLIYVLCPTNNLYKINKNLIIYYLKKIKLSRPTNNILNYSKKT